MDFNINDIFIETDIIEQQKYGLTYRSLLAIITRDTNNSTRKQARIINPHYLKLNKSRINTITISICDVNGNLLNLVGENNIIVQLHFRKIKNGL